MPPATLHNKYQKRQNILFLKLRRVLSNRQLDAPHLATVLTCSAGVLSPPSGFSHSHDSNAFRSKPTQAVPRCTCSSSKPIVMSYGSQRKEDSRVKRGRNGQQTTVTETGCTYIWKRHGNRQIWTLFVTQYLICCSRRALLPAPVLHSRLPARNCRQSVRRLYTGRLHKSRLDTQQTQG